MRAGKHPHRTCTSSRTLPASAAPGSLQKRILEGVQLKQQSNLCQLRAYSGCRWLSTHASTYAHTHTCTRRRCNFSLIDLAVPPHPFQNTTRCPLPLSLWCCPMCTNACFGVHMRRGICLHGRMSWCQHTPPGCTLAAFIAHHQGPCVMWGLQHAACRHATGPSIVIH